MTQNTQNKDTLTQQSAWKSWSQALNAGPLSGTIVTYFLVLLAIAQIGLVGWTYWPQPAVSASNQPLFAELEVDEVVAITIVDDNENQIALAQNNDGDWMLPNAGEFPVTASKVDGLLEKIVEINTSRLVASNESSYGRLSVAEDDFISRVELTLADDTVHTLYIGTSPRTMATHVRSGEGEAVYLASNLRSSDAGTQPRNWIETQYLQIASDEITEMSITNANGELTFSKTEDNEWAMANLGEGEEFSDNNLTTMLSSITSLNMVEPLGTEELPEYGMDEPSAVVTITALETILPRSDELTGGDELTISDNSSGSAENAASDEESAAIETEPKTYTLTIGAKAEEGNNYVVKSSESPYYVHVSGFTVERFIERGRSDFITEVEVSSESDSGSDEAAASEDKESSLLPFSPLIPGENMSWISPLVESSVDEEPAMKGPARENSVAERATETTGTN